MELFKIEHLDFTYPGQIKKALNNISFSVRAGEIITLCGASGCGKSTLLRHLKSVLSPFGQCNGAVYFKGKQIGELDAREEAEKIGFVSQSADNQIVTDKVYHELAFGLESLAYDNEKIRQRVAEMASFFGIQDWFYKNVSELSGGQKQILSLASIMTMLPEVLVLDEPTSQLDPIAALEFVNMLIKINRELGVTIIITEHRLDEIIPYSDRVIVMEEGQIIADDKPVNVCLKLKEEGHAMLLSMPVSMRIWNGVQDGEETCPLTVNEGRIWLENYAARHEIRQETEQSVSQKAITQSQERIIELKEIWFKYGKGERDILKRVNLCVNKGEILGILGGNGTGKSTLLSVMSGIRKPYRGKVVTKDKVGMLTQNPKNLFVKKTVAEDLREVCSAKQEEKLEEVIKLCRLDKLLRHNPYDLSGGEQQRAAMAKVLLTEPDILLLDEPTKGMDNEYKQELGQMLMHMAEAGTTVIMVSHDIEFCAEWTDRCALFFDGNIISERDTREFFINNSFYTTTANRMARNVLPAAVTPKDVIDACNGSGKSDSGIGRGKMEEKSIPVGRFENRRGDSALTKSGNDKRYPDIKKEGENADVKSGKSMKSADTGKTDKRFLTAAIMIFIAIPFTIFSGIYF
ncbi:MAG: ATP-binding cassette domain-containing protein, partial [Lachnospiraceae bacterium]|nr:ATP-binding cassette domain-containing protein [Lachnospiraceae bacterium]